MTDPRTEPDTEFPEDSSFTELVVTFVIVLVTALGGGFLCGLMIDQFGATGSISLWSLGFLAGRAAVTAKCSRSLFLAASLVAACIVALVVAETFWIQWNTQDTESFSAAFAKFPWFLKQFKVPAFIAGIFTFFGCHAAYRQTAPTR